MGKERLGGIGRNGLFHSVAVGIAWTFCPFLNCSEERSVREKRIATEFSCFSMRSKKMRWARWSCSLGSMEGGGMSSKWIHSHPRSFSIPIHCNCERFVLVEASMDGRVSGICLIRSLASAGVMDFGSGIRKNWCERKLVASSWKSCCSWLTAFP